MCIPVAANVRTYPRLTSLLPLGLASLVVAASGVPRLAHAFKMSSPTVASPVQAATPTTTSLNAAIQRYYAANDNQTLGVAAFNAGNVDQAIQYFQTALKLRPAFADASYNPGIAFQAKKDYKSAVASFSKVIELKPEFADAWAQRGVSYGALGDSGSALKDFVRFVALEPDNSDADEGRLRIYTLKM